MKKLKSLSCDDYARVEDLVNRLCFDSAGGNQNDYDRNISCLLKCIKGHYEYLYNAPGGPLSVIFF